MTLYTCGLSSVKMFAKKITAFTDASFFDLIEDIKSYHIKWEVDLHFTAQNPGIYPKTADILVCKKQYNMIQFMQFQETKLLIWIQKVNTTTCDVHDDWMLSKFLNQFILFHEVLLCAD